MFCYAETSGNTLCNGKQCKDLHLNFKNIIYTKDNWV